MTLRLKILIYIILTIAIIFTVTVGLVNYRYTRLMISMANRIADMYTEQSANTAKTILDGDLKAAQTLKNVFIVISTMNLSQSQKIKYLQKVLIEELYDNKEFLSVWASWELSNLNPNWTAPYGRLRIMAFWNKGTISVAIDSADIAGDNYTSDYYKLKSGFSENILTNPYKFSYTQDTSTTYLEASIGTGVWIADDFIGAVGVDVTLDRFQKILSHIKPFKNSEIIIISNDGTIVAHSKSGYVGRNITSILGEFFNFNLLDTLRIGRSFSTNIFKAGKQYYVSFAPIYLEGTNTPWSLAFIVPTSTIFKDIYKNTRLSILLSAVGLIFIALLLWFTLTQIIKPIEKVTNTLEKLSKGYVDKSLKIDVNRKDELGVMAQAVNQLIEALNKTVEFAQQIGKGQLDAHYELLSDEDKLGKALIEMKQNLLETRRIEEQQKEEARKLSWQQAGLSELNEILRLKSENLNILAEEVLVFLIKYLEANQGGFYVIEEKEGKPMIVLKAAYAYDRKKQLEAQIEMGEGLIGRAVQEKRYIHLDNLPQGYVYITSGLGGATPQNLIILPFIFEDQVFGAIEILSFNPYEDYQVEFLKQSAERIASTISIIKKNIETQELLKQLQLQTATFEMKEKQFARLNKRLKNLQKDLELKAVEIEMIFDAFSLLASVIEIDKQKIIRSINNKLPQLLDALPEEFIGINIDQIQQHKQSKKWLDNFWQDIFKGITRKKYTIYKFKNKEIRMEEVYIPIFDKEKNLTKIVIIGIG